MSYIGYVLIGLVAAIVALAIYVRVAPIRAQDWHTTNVPVMEPGEYPSADSFLVQRPLQGDGRQVLAQLDRIIRDTPRTSQIAGSVEEGKITYVTRSLIWGFPDFTTVTLTPLPDTDSSTLQVYGRLKFGKADLGVNRARIEGWMAQLDADA